jgi:hypothetical protein
MFERAEQRDGMCTRLAVGINNLKVPAARTEIRKNFFTVRTVSDWNSLPNELKVEPSKEKFKRALCKIGVPGGRS